MMGKPLDDETRAKLLEYAKESLTDLAKNLNPHCQNDDCSSTTPIHLEVGEIKIVNSVTDEDLLVVEGELKGYCWVCEHWSVMSTMMLGGPGGAETTARDLIGRYDKKVKQQKQKHYNN